MNVPANKAIYKTVYRRVPRGASAVVELTNKDNTKTTFNGNVYSDNVVFYIPSNYVTADNLPATAVYKIGDSVVTTVSYDLPAAPSTGGGDGGPTAWSEVTGKPTVFPPNTHQHVVGDVSNLQSALDAKASTSALNAKADASALAAKADASALSSKADTSALTTGLAGKANTSHTHALTDTTNLLPVLQDLDGKFVALASSKMDTEFALEELDKKLDKAGTKTVVVSTTAPTDLTAVWIDIS